MPVLPSEALRVLAEHFTGTLVAYHRACLVVDGVHGAMAKLFFDTREKLGIQEYDTAEKAEQTLRNLLCSPPIDRS